MAAAAPAAAPEEPKGPCRILVDCFKAQYPTGMTHFRVGPTVEFRSGERRYDEWIRDLEHAISSYEKDSALFSGPLEVIGNAPYPLFVKAGQLLDRTPARAFNQYGSHRTDAGAFMKRYQEFNTGPRLCNGFTMLYEDSEPVVTATILVVPKVDAQTPTVAEIESVAGELKLAVAFGEDSKADVPINTMVGVRLAANFARLNGAKTINVHFWGTPSTIALCVGTALQQRFFGKDVVLQVADRMPDGTDTLVKV